MQWSSVGLQMFRRRRERKERARFDDPLLKHPGTFCLKSEDAQRDGHTARRSSIPSCWNFIPRTCTFASHHSGGKRLVGLACLKQDPQASLGLSNALTPRYPSARVAYACVRHVSASNCIMAVDLHDLRRLHLPETSVNYCFTGYLLSM